MIARTLRRFVVRALLGAFLLVPAAPALAGDHYNLEKGLPTEVEDAYPTAYRNREIQSVIRWERTDDGDHYAYIEPTLEIGALPNTELQVSVPLKLGAEDEKGSGDVDLSALYNFNQESLWLPALALEGTLTLPTGEESRGFDTELKLLLTKTLGATSYFNQLHLNVSWLHNAEARDKERDDLYSVVAGYSMRLGADWTLVLDYAYEEQKEKNIEYNLVEAGLRWQFTPLLVLSLGGGVGVSDDSPEGRVTGGVQYSF